MSEILFPAYKQSRLPVPIMKTKTIYRQELAWELSPSKESGRKIAGKNEGFHLPNSVTEDVGGFSLMPYYSAKQLRSIKRRAMAQ